MQGQGHALQRWRYTLKGPAFERSKSPSLSRLQGRTHGSDHLLCAECNHQHARAPKSCSWLVYMLCKVSSSHRHTLNRRAEPPVTDHGHWHRTHSRQTVVSPTAHHPRSDKTRPPLWQQELSRASATTPQAAPSTAASPRAWSSESFWQPLVAKGSFATAWAQHHPSSQTH